MKLADRIIWRATRRTPDFIIGGSANPYLRRWWLIPRNRMFNVYLHHFLRDDDDRALHDHPWFNLSVLLRGSYCEHTISAGGINHRRTFKAGEFRFRTPWTAHRVELIDGSAWSLFVTGPRLRDWGFHCPEGWVHWRDFTSKDGREIGKGCAQ